MEVIRSDGSKQSFFAKLEVIVSGGAVNSPQILLLSGIGPREELQQVRRILECQQISLTSKNKKVKLCFEIRGKI